MTKTGVRSVCVCGGGHIGHAAAAYLAATGVGDVRVLTRQPECWSTSLEAILPDGTRLIGRASCVTDDALRAVEGVDLVLITVPKFGVAAVLDSFRGLLTQGQAVMAIPGGAGFNWMCLDLIDRGVAVLGLQRVPFIARTEVYGRSVHIQGFKKQLKLATLPRHRGEIYRQVTAELFDTDTITLSNFLSITLNNSNPLLHPARLTTLFSGYQSGVTYDQPSFFYEQWDDRASESLIGADRELMDLCAAIPLDLSEVQPICDYYEVADAPGLTRKITSIAAFKGIKSPMLQVGTQWIPDLTSRYFIEDIPFGTLPIKALADMAGVRSPIMSGFIEWIQNQTGIKYMNDGRLSPEGCGGLPVPQNYGIDSLDTLVDLEGSTQGVKG